MKRMVVSVSRLEAQVVNVIIDKTRFRDMNYRVLENALKYNIQRIENDSRSQWNYMIITDQGRLAPMRSTARAIRAYNPIQSKYSYEYMNQPIFKIYGLHLVIADSFLSIRDNGHEALRGFH